MIITINTKEDSREEIKRAIQMLMRLVDHEPVTNSPDFIPPASEGIFNIFDDTATTAESAEENKEESPERIEVYDY